MSHSRRPFLAVTGLGMLFGPRWAVAAWDAVKGSGVAGSQHRDVGSFTAVSINAPFSVVLRMGSREGVDIVADDNILALVETTIRSRGDERILRIDLQRRISIEPKTPIEVTVDVVRIGAIALEGSGNLTGNGLKTARLDASIGGSGNIRLGALEATELALSIAGSGAFAADGRARKVAVNISGSGRCDAERLIASDVAVSIAGSGDARVHADASLSASIAGSGDVLYSGAAALQVSTAGSGRVRRI